MLKYVLPTALITWLYIRFSNNGSWSYSCSDSRVVGNLANSFISCVHTFKCCLIRMHSTSDAQEALCGEVFSCCYSTVVNHEYMLVTIGVKMLVPVSVQNHSFVRDTADWVWFYHLLTVLVYIFHATHQQSPRKPDFCWFIVCIC